MSLLPKFSRDEVPQKLSEWLLAMGCPEDKIPCTDKISQMCRGEYYMVWRGLMERVHPRNTVKQKRLQVFCDDLKKCADSKHAKDSVVTPEELVVWREHHTVKRERENLEKHIADLRKKLDQAVDKVSNKVAHRNLARRKSEDAWRRVWLLQTAAEELRVQRSNLHETRGIAESLCRVSDSDDPQINIEKCVSLLSKQSSPTGGALIGSLSMVAGSNPVACSSIIQTANETNDDTDEQLTALVNSPANEVWKQLLARRAALVESLTCAYSHQRKDIIQEQKVTPQFILANTAALHATLALNAMKCRLQLKQTKKMLQQAIAELSDTLSGPECELVVLRCELESCQARVASLSQIVNEIEERRSPFQLATQQAPGGSVSATNIAQCDRDIVSKKEEIKGLLSSLSKTEAKMQKVRESLLGIFNGFQKDITTVDKIQSGSVKREPDLGTVTAVRQFYQQRRHRRPRLDLSMELDSSDYSYLDDIGKELEPRFVDELRLYLKKFNLEANRKLVLQNGEKIWIFETLQASADRLCEHWLKEDVTCSLLKPSVSMSVSLKGLIEMLKKKTEMDIFASSLQSTTPKIPASLEYRINREDEEKKIDKIKKRLQENTTSLGKVNKTIDLSLENMNLWSENKWRLYLSEKRKIDGKTYQEFQSIYMKLLNPV